MPTKKDAESEQPVETEPKPTAKKPAKKATTAKKTNPNTKNLTPFQSSEEAREAGRKGGIKSGQVRRERREKRRAMSETFDIVLNMPFKDGESKDLETIESFKEATGSNVTVQDMLVLSVLRTAIKKGDANSFKTIMELLGESNSSTVMPIPVFVEDLKKMLEKKE